MNETQDISTANKYKTKEFQPYKKRSSNGDSLQDILRADDQTNQYNPSMVYTNVEGVKAGDKTVGQLNLKNL